EDRLLWTSSRFSTALCSASSAAVFQSTTAPTTNVLHDGDDGGNIGGQIGNINGSSFQMRGDLFSLGDSTIGTQFEITGIVLESNARTYDGSTMTVALFEGTASSFGAGDGGTDSGGIGTAFTTGPDGSQVPLAGITILETEAFNLDLSVDGTNGTFVEFRFTTPVLVDENSDFGVLFDFDAEPGAASGFTYLYDESQNGGGRITVTSSANSTGSSRSLNFYVLGSEVPEPGSLALLGLGGLLVTRRRRG
ncbi:MAG: PEP-CTERM sorting domain-containing protein, partial [Planctomycetota bacterium]